MKIEIDANKALGTILVAAVLAAFTWMWTINERVAKIESPDSMLSRVETLETLILPLAIEHEVHKRVEEIAASDLPQPPPISGVLPTRLNDSIAPTVEATPNQPVNAKLRGDAEDRVRSLIEQRPLKEVKNRRGRPLKFKSKKKSE